MDACKRFVLPLCQKAPDGSNDPWFKEKCCTGSLMSAMGEALQVPIQIVGKGMDMRVPDQLLEGKRAWDGILVQLIFAGEHYCPAWQD